MIREWWNFAKNKPGEFAFICLCLFVGISWGGSKGDTPSVTRKGIKWKSVNVTPEGISGEWEAEDERISADAEYIIEYRKKWIMLGDTIVDRPEDMQWKEFARTKDTKFAKKCWLLDSTYDIRVRTVVREGESE
jgi:hypothetical protein